MQIRKLPSFVVSLGLVSSCVWSASTPALAVAVPASTFVVTKIEDTSDGTCDADCSLREAIIAANANADVSTITFDPTVFNTAKTITVYSDLPPFSANVTVTGPAAGVTIDGFNKALSLFLAYEGVQAEFIGLTVTRGNYGISNQGTTIITRCTLNNNNIGVFNSAQGSVTVNNSTISGGYPSGIYSSGTANVNSSTVSKNLFGIKNFGTLNVQNSIVAGNESDFSNIDNVDGGTFNNNGHNLTSGDPKLGPLQDNGGPTFTMLPAADSPAIDQGESAEATDQRGVLRPQNVIDDIGAVESLGALEGGSLVVSTTADTDDGNYSPGNNSLREAIKFANADASDSAVTFDATVFAAKETITLGGTELLLANNGKLTITGPAAGVVISGNLASRVFNVATGADVTLEKLTIRDGRVSGGFNSTNKGGGIFNNGKVTLTGSTVSANSVGGGDYSGNYGGGIYNDGTVTLTNSTLSGNSASGGQGSVSVGGGVFNNTGDTLTLTDSTLSGNSANGGFNSANYGGGIYSDGTVTLTNSTLSGNSVSGAGSSNYGGGIDSDGTVTLTNSTLSSNSASGGDSDNSGGGINTSDGTVNSGNSIIAGNSAATGPDVFGAFTSQGFNLIGKTDDSTGFTNGLNGDKTGTVATPLDAKLGALKDNRGPTFTHMPAADSPALNAGDTDLATDQRGVLRPQPVGGADDIGAVERGALRDGPNFVVTVTEDSDDGNYAAEDISLREAIKFASADASDSAITFDATVFAAKETITLGGTELLLINDGKLTITGPAAGVVISGNQASRVFNVATGADVTLNKLTIRDGKVSDGEGSFNEGGGIFSRGKLTIINSTLSDNSVSGGFGNYGGGIHNRGGALTLTNSTLSGNSASGGSFNYGGGIFNTEGGTVTLMSSTLSGNSASGGQGSATTGGGIFSNSTNAIIASNSIIAGNSAATGPDVFGVVISQGFNLICKTDDSTGFTNGLNGDKTGTVAAPLDAKLGALAENGGPTQTHALLVGSPAIDAGNTELETDQRGVLRPRGATVDIGSVEVVAVRPVVDLDGPEAEEGVEEDYDFAATFTQGDGPVNLTDSDATVTDPQSTELSSLTVAITNFQTGDVLNADGDNTNITASYDATTGVLTLSGADTIAHYQQVLRTVTFNSAANPLDTTDCSITFVATDSDNNNSNIATTTLTVTIAPDNSAPTVSNISKTAQEDTALAFAAADFDAGFADEDALTAIKITSLPTSGVLLLDGEAVAVNDEIIRADISKLTYKANLNYHSTDSFGWNGSDGTVYAQADALVNITVEEVNDNPTLDEIPTINGDEGVAINFFARGEDVDTGTTLTYSLIGAPAGATINSATGEFNWTPSEAQGGQSYTFQIKVTDGEGGEAIRDVTIHVAEANAAPVLPFVGARTLFFGRTTTFNFAATDADLPRNTLSYSLINAPAGASINPTTGVFSWTPTAAQANLANNFYSFRVRVTDNGSPSKSDEETASFTVQYPADIVVNQINPSVKADGLSKSVTLVYTVRNNTNAAQSNLRVQGDVFWPTTLQSVTLTPATGTTATQSTLTASSRRILWSISSLPAFSSRTLSVRLTGVVPTTAPQRSRIASGFVLSPVSGTAIPNHTSPEVFLNTFK